MDSTNFEYRWVILVSCSVLYGLSFGTHAAVGVFYTSWIRDFKESARTVALLGSLPSSIGCMLGPIYAMIFNKIGGRPCGMLGGIFVFSGLVLSSIASNITALYFTFGIITGFGIGLTNISLSSALNAYFTRERAFAEGITGGGYNTGMFLGALLIQACTDSYSWRGAILVSGAYCLNICVGSMLLVPVSEIRNNPLNLWRTKATANCAQIKSKKRQNSRLNDDSNDDKVIEASESSSNVERRPSFWKRSLTLFRNPVFLLILSSDLITWLAIYVPHVHLVERARQEGASPNFAAWFASACGLAGIVGRPLTGFVSTYYNIDAILCYCTMQTALGLANLVSTFWSNLQMLFAYAIAVGFLSNGYGFIKSAAAVLLGRENFVDAYSWMLLIEGIAIAIGPLTAGFIYDVTQSYDWAFRFSGISLILSAAMFIFIKPAMRSAEKAQRISESKSIDIS